MPRLSESGIAERERHLDHRLEVGDGDVLVGGVDLRHPVREVEAAAAALDQAKAIFDGLQHGKIDRALFTANANAYFSDQALADFASSLGPLGTPQSFVQQSQGLRGGMRMRSFRVTFPQRTLRVWTFTMPDGTLEQYMVAAAG